MSRTIAPSFSALPREHLADRAPARVPRSIWWPLASLALLAVLFDPLNYLTSHAVYFVAAVVALVLISSLLVSHNQPMHLRAFDVVFGLLMFYMAVNVLGMSVTDESTVDAVLRFLRLAAQLCVFYAIVTICDFRPALRTRFLQLYWWMVILICLYALLQTFGQQTGMFNLFFDYHSTRDFRTVWQVTGPFAEPALLGQFLVAALFVFFNQVEQVYRHWRLFALIIVTIGFTQSVGALVGLLAWTVFLVLYNYPSMLSLRRLDVKLTVAVLVGTALLTFSLLSRVPLIDLMTLDLDSSGHTRVVNELIAFNYLVERGVSDLVFGLGEAAARIARPAAGVGNATVGNGLIELMLRNGAFAVALLGIAFCALRGLVKGLLLFAVFALLGQIDGAVAKPYIWLYMGLIALSLVPRRTPTAMRPVGALPPQRLSRSAEGSTRVGGAPGCRARFGEG